MNSIESERKSTKKVTTRAEAMDVDRQQRLNQLPNVAKRIQQSIDELKAIAEVGDVAASTARLIAARLQQDVDRLTHLGTDPDGGL